MITNTTKLVNKRNGESPTDNDEMIKEWAAHFKELLNVRNEERSTEIPPAATDLDSVWIILRWTNFKEQLTK